MRRLNEKEMQKQLRLCIQALRHLVEEYYELMNAYDEIMILHLKFPLHLRWEEPSETWTSKDASNLRFLRCLGVARNQTIQLIQLSSICNIGLGLWITKH